MSLAKKFIIINLLWNWAIKRVSVSSMCEPRLDFINEIPKDFLLIVKRFEERDGEIVTKFERKLLTASQVCDFYEYRDLEYGMENWEIYFIDGFELRRPFILTVKGSNYENGDHTICVCYDVPQFESGKSLCNRDMYEFPTNIICSRYYSHDH